MLNVRDRVRVCKRIYDRNFQVIIIISFFPLLHNKDDISYINFNGKEGQKVIVSCLIVHSRKTSPFNGKRMTNEIE